MNSLATRSPDIAKFFPAFGRVQRYPSFAGAWKGRSNVEFIAIKGIGAMHAHRCLAVSPCVV